MADRPIRVQQRRTKGYKLPPNTVSVARGPGRKWGNPFVIGESINGRGPIDRQGAVQMFRDMLADPELTSICGYPTDLSPLRGKNLACFCPLDQPCHADVLLDLANGRADT